VMDVPYATDTKESAPSAKAIVELYILKIQLCRCCLSYGADVK
jgi:hypothetical protein